VRLERLPQLVVRSGLDRRRERVDDLLLRAVEVAELVEVGGLTTLRRVAREAS
jgi:hypothetical protein